MIKVGDRVRINFGIFEDAVGTVEEIMSKVVSVHLDWGSSYKYFSHEVDKISLVALETYKGYETFFCADDSHKFYVKKKEGGYEPFVSYDWALKWIDSEVVVPKVGDKVSIPPNLVDPSVSRLGEVVDIRPSGMLKVAVYHLVDPKHVTSG